MNATAETPKIDTKLIVPFARSTQNVFATMASTKTEVLRPYVKEGSTAPYDVSGIIGFSGGIVGSVVLSFQLATARQLVAAFAGADIDPDSPDFADAVGELANMVIGSAKKDLGAIADITPPTVIIGHGHAVARLRGTPCVVIPCRAPAGEFAVEVNIRASEGNP